MNKFYGIIVGIITLIALAWVIQLTLEGKPVAKIKLSEFENPQAFSEAIKMRLRQELKDHQYVFLGVDTEEVSHLQVWKHFIREMSEPGWKFDEILVEKGLPHYTPMGIGERLIDVKEMETSLKSSLNESLNKNKRIVFIVPSIYSSQLIKNNPVQRLKDNPNEGRFLSLSLAPLSENTNEVELNRIPCAAEGSDFTGQSPLGCMIRKKAMFWKKPFKNNKYLGIVEQVGLHDYLAFWRKPQESSQKNTENHPQQTGK